MINVIERELHVDRPDLVYIKFSGDNYYVGWNLFNPDDDDDVCWTMSILTRVLLGSVVRYNFRSTFFLILLSTASCLVVIIDGDLL